MKNSTLLFLVKREDRIITDVCLAMKKRGFGTGKYNGVGGKVEGGESIEDATKRETKEEIGVSVVDMKKCAEINFEFPDKADWSQTVHFYLAETWEGEPIETEEMKPEWFKVSDIPYQTMWPDDTFWLPPVLLGKYVTGKFILGENTSIISHDLKIS